MADSRLSPPADYSQTIRVIDEFCFQFFPAATKDGGDDPDA
jgi:hypothetical protein